MLIIAIRLVGFLGRIAGRLFVALIEIERGGVRRRRCIWPERSLCRRSWRGLILVRHEIRGRRRRLWRGGAARIFPAVFAKRVSLSDQAGKLGERVATLGSGGGAGRWFHWFVWGFA